MSFRGAGPAGSSIIQGSHFCGVESVYQDQRVDLGVERHWSDEIAEEG